MIINANSLQLPLASGSVQCCVTSPPYWGLRDYGIPGQLGLEPTPEEYTAHMVEVFREVWRVLRDDGTLWLNLGDSYANDTKWGGESGGKNYTSAAGGYAGQREKRSTGLKPKDLVGIPWRVAFALQADGWYLRSDIIWAKPNPMPESVTDRPTKAHEYIFLLSKSQKYFYDADAVREECITESNVRCRDDEAWATRANFQPLGKGTREWNHPAGRNRRTVWTIATEPTPYAHFATYPRALVEPCIKAGSRAGDVVLDPFFGSGTTGIVARQLGRRFVGVDLSFTYLHDIARRRLGLDALEAWTEGIQAGDDGYHDLPLFTEVLG